MCRFIAYIGKDSILLSDLLIKPRNSLIKQSLISKESDTVTNGDGFGLGWYTDYDKTPALFTSLFPAWNDKNLSYLAKKTKAALFFAHIRAASAGGISQFNCHPFLYKNWLFMHNGLIPHFEKIKRQLHNMLDDDIYNWIQGSTDTELIFALFLQCAKKYKIKSGSDIAHILQETLNTIDALVKSYYKNSICYFNICITNGHRIVAFRYCTSLRPKPETMYFSLGENIPTHPFPYEKKENNHRSVIIASEKLCNERFKWQPIPANNGVIIEPNLNISIQKLFF